MAPLHCLLDHDPEKPALGPRPDRWVSVFPSNKRETRLRGDHAQTKSEKRDDDSSSSHRALSGVAVCLRQFPRNASRRDRRLQFLQFRFQIFVGHDQRLDGAAQIAIAHRDRLVAGLFVTAVVEGPRCGHDELPKLSKTTKIMFLFCSQKVKPRVWPRVEKIEPRIEPRFEPRLEAKSGGFLRRIPTAAHRLAAVQLAGANRYRV